MEKALENTATTIKRGIKACLVILTLAMVLLLLNSHKSCSDAQ